MATFWISCDTTKSVPGELRSPVFNNLAPSCPRKSAGNDKHGLARFSHHLARQSVCEARQDEARAAQRAEAYLYSTVVSKRNEVMAGLSRTSAVRW